MNKKEIRLAVEDEAGNLVLEEDQIKSRYNRYYTELLKVREPTPNSIKYVEEVNKMFQTSMTIFSYDGEEINETFKMEELDDIMKSIKPGKSPGPDEVGNEVLGAAGKQLRKSMLNMFNYFWQQEELPEDLYNIHIKSMYKGKGAVTDLNNQRGVFISNTILKIYEILIFRRIRPKLEKSFTEMQAGARKGRSTTDLLFMLRSIANYYKYINPMKKP